MMKEEFEELLGMQVDYNDYSVIEKVYACEEFNDDFLSKRDFVIFYEHVGFDAIKMMARLVDKIDEEKKATREVRSRLSVMQEVVHTYEVLYMLKRNNFSFNEVVLNNLDKGKDVVCLMIQCCNPSVAIDVIENAYDNMNTQLDELF